MVNKHNQTDTNQAAAHDAEQDKNEGFEVTDQAQQLGGGKGAGGGTEIGNFGDDDFVKTDQSIAQASPGKTSNFENTGGSE